MKYLLLSFFLLSVTYSYSQDIFTVNVGGYNAEVRPRRIIINDNNRFILYQKDPPSIYSSQSLIGLQKIDGSTNQILYDIQISENLGYWVDARDIEVFGNNIYLLVNINFTTPLLLTIDKSNGTIIKKEKIVLNGINNDFFIVKDLAIVQSDNSLDPYVTIIGLGSTAGSYDNKIILLYKHISQANFTEVDFICNTASIGFIQMDDVFWTQNYLQITSLSPSGGFDFQYHIPSNTIENSFEYSMNNQPFRFLKHFFWDGMYLLYGQMENNNYQNGYTIGTSNDLFVIYPSNNFYTYNNPFFLGMSEDSHYTATWSTFGGVYYDPNDVNNPRYAIGKIDFSNMSMDLLNSGWSPLSANVYQLRSFGTYSPNSFNFTGGSRQDFYTMSTSCDYLIGNQLTGVFYRKPVGSDDASAFYYMKQMTNNSCNNVINFTRTYDKSLFKSPVNFTTNIYSTISMDLNIGYNYVYSQSSSTCIEPLTNSKKSIVHNSLPIETENDEIKIYPNPFSNYVICTSKKSLKQIVVFTSEGKKIIMQNNINKNDIYISLSSLASNTYYIKITFDDNSQSIKKIIKL